MIDEEFIQGVEGFFKKYFPSLVELKVHGRSDSIRVVFGDAYDFVVAVLAASGANIEVHVCGIFGEGQHGKRDIDSCLLRLEFPKGCLDARLVHFMYETLQMKNRDEIVGEDDFEKTKSLLRKYEFWLEQRS